MQADSSNSGKGRLLIALLLRSTVLCKALKREVFSVYWMIFSLKSMVNNVRPEGSCKSCATQNRPRESRSMMILYLFLLEYICMKNKDMKMEQLYFQCKKRTLCFLCENTTVSRPSTLQLSCCKTKASKYQCSEDCNNQLTTLRGSIIRE